MPVASAACASSGGRTLFPLEADLYTGAGGHMRPLWSCVSRRIPMPRVYRLESELRTGAVFSRLRRVLISCSLHIGIFILNVASII